MNKISKLEALRGFAALYVVIHHTVSDKVHLGSLDITVLFRFGQEAVILFFILSGIVIQLSYEKGIDKSFTTYFLKRFLRIYIPLLIVFFTNYLIFYFEDTSIKVDYYSLICNLLMLQDNHVVKLNVISRTFLDNGPLWSLSYEWWFYMVFFLFTYFIKKNVSFWVYVIGIVSAVSYIFYPFFVNRLLMYLVIWWVGTDIARVYLKGQSFSLRNLWKPLSALLVCIIILRINQSINKEEWSRLLNVTTPGFSPYLEVRHFLFAFLVIGCALIWKKLNWFGFSSIFGMFEPLAKISFGVYISHYFLISNAHYLDFISNIILRYSFYILICVAFSYLIERVIYVKLNKVIMNKYYSNKNKKIDV